VLPLDSDLGMASSSLAQRISKRPSSPLSRCGCRGAQGEASRDVDDDDGPTQVPWHATDDLRCLSIRPSPARPTVNQAAAVRRQRGTGPRSTAIVASTSRVEARGADVPTPVRHPRPLSVAAQGDVPGRLPPVPARLLTLSGSMS